MIISTIIAKRVRQTNSMRGAYFQPRAFSFLQTGDDLKKIASLRISPSAEHTPYRGSLDGL
jgi:hypothetical protein